MKTLLLILFGCLVFTAASAQQNERWRLFGPRKKAETPTTQQTPDNSTPTAQPPSKRDSSAKKAPIKGAHLHMPTATHNFGDVPRKGGDLVKEFPFTNDGEVPLVVTRVITSCSCLKASFSKRPVAPGGQGVIRITYEPYKSEPGVFNKVIQIYSNSIDRRDIISVQGNSIDLEQMPLKDNKNNAKIKK